MMSNRLVGALSRRPDPAITLCCAFHRPPGHVAGVTQPGGSRRFSGTGSVSFCLDGSMDVQKADDAKWASKLGARRGIPTRIHETTQLCAWFPVLHSAAWVAEVSTKQLFL
jgi:hypothetical protein